MLIKLVALDGHTFEVGKKAVHEAALPNVVIEKGDICEIEADAYVSPANSYGFFDGGIDARYTRFYAEHGYADLTAGVQQRINYFWDGYLPVGCAIYGEFDDVPNLIVAPTMPVPMDVSGTENAYLAARAAMHCAWRRLANLEAIAVPAMCTGVGKMPPARAWWQILTAIEEVFEKRDRPPANTIQGWQSRHEVLREIV